MFFLLQNWKLSGFREKEGYTEKKIYESPFLPANDKKEMLPEFLTAFNSGTATVSKSCPSTESTSPQQKIRVNFLLITR